MLWLYGKPKWLSILLVTDIFMSVELPIAMWYSHFQSKFDALASTSGLFIQICMILIHCLVFREQFFRFRTFRPSSATFISISRQLLFVKNFFRRFFSPQQAGCLPVRGCCFVPAPVGWRLVLCYSLGWVLSRPWWKLFIVSCRFTIHMWHSGE